MAATDGQIVVAAARWSDEGCYLREFITKNRLPAVVKIVKGQYGGLGVPSLPSPGLQSMALLVSAGRRQKIVAQAVKVKEGRRLSGIGPRLAIPDSYPGYFELLSEEGRSVRCMESVGELARRRPEAGCLVREPMRALSARLESDGTVVAEGARHIPAGETLFPAGDTHIGGSKVRYLRCLDSHGDNVLLSLEQRGKFSALAREDNISGVHTAKNLLSKRMPLTVRLVHGTPPRGLKSSSHFVPELRLLSTFEEEHIFALPLQKESNALIALPLAATLKLQKTRNDDQLKNFMEYSRLVEKCNRLVSDVADRVHVLDGKLGDPKRVVSNSQPPPVVKTGYFLRRSASSDSANQKYSHISHTHSHSHHRELCHSHRDENRVPLNYSEEYDEIDQIYDYVRGFAPLPKNIKSPFADTSPVKHESAPVSPTTTPTHIAIIAEIDTRPEPPPIETIPSKKLTKAHVPPSGKAEKRTRKGTTTTRDVPPSPKAPPSLPKLYIKNGSSQRSRMFRPTSVSPLKDQPPSPVTNASHPVLTKAGSPLFNIRYKSLTNLQQAMELDGTLDSSHSGGRTSGDSGAGAKLPEKRSRRLSRPRSLTNLVWELRGCPESPPERSKSRSKGEPNVHRKGTAKLSISGQRRSGTLYL